ncbi:acyl-CoA dehydrogenase family protein [Saccharothrix obliqua]|uniref:acyl-CoA dehydrogenase family protein n=1 Tax=Saccharothrix obliqua TaxID=2861747 RepID=UPI0027E2E76F|nr:acyl-CoA dehydrogenase family protein [Saccharothrix obliqua]
MTFASTGLDPDQRLARERFAAFADEHLVPHADAWDAAGELPPAVVALLADHGYLGAAVPVGHGGEGLDEISFGMLCEEVGRACSSVRSLLTVHSMVSHAVARWGSPGQRERWLPELATGRAVGAFALTEPGAGSDAGAITTRAERVPGGYALTGHKHWITCAGIAGVFLVFAKLAGEPTAFLVERDRPGLSVTPRGGALGTRASHLGDVLLDDCRVPDDARVSRPGFGLTAVGASALELGRYSVAWGCVGLVEACAAASLAHADSREQFGRPLREHQLVQRMLADMVTAAAAARLLCRQAGLLRQAGDPRSVQATWLAKYFAAGAAMRAADDAVQVHGARGIGGDHPVQRYLRDAKVMEIIEGSTQLQQITIAEAAYMFRARSEPDRAPGRQWSVTT